MFAIGVDTTSDITHGAGRYFGPICRRQFQTSVLEVLYDE